MTEEQIVDKFKADKLTWGDAIDELMKKGLSRGDAENRLRGNKILTK